MSHGWLLLSACGFLQLCSAQKLTCTVRRDAEHTAYSVGSVDDTRCEYSWARKRDTGHQVLAHHKEEKDELVRSKNISTLIASKCFDVVYYKRSCISENMDLTATCTANCSKNALSEEYKDTSRMAVVLPVVMLTLMLVGILIYKFKKSKVKSVNDVHCPHMACLE